MQGGVCAAPVDDASPHPPASPIQAAQHADGLMGEIVNLKKFRKRAERDRAAKVADARRARFGRSKVERKQVEDENRKRNSQLDHHRIGEDQT